MSNDDYQFKLGLVPHNKENHELLEVTFGASIAFPVVVDNLRGINPALDKNDQLGDCGPTSCDNHRRIKSLLETGKEFDANLDEVLDLYALSTNPPFDKVTYANDNGVMMPDLMNAMRKNGLGSGDRNEKIVAFGRLRDMSDESIMAAIYVFKAVIFAVTLQESQKNQSRSGYWDWSQSEDWGGHAIVAGAFDANQGTIDVISWARRIQTTKTFRAHQLDEVWVPIYQSTIDDTKDFVDYATMADQFQRLTGNALPGYTPAPPVQPPAPTPNTGAAPFPGCDPEVASHIVATAARGHRSVEAWLNNHFKHYFHL
jgi:hypothetical protein